MTTFPAGLQVVVSELGETPLDAMERHLRGLMATLFEDEAFEGPPPRFFA